MRPDELQRLMRGRSTDGGQLASLGHRLSMSGVIVRNGAQLARIRHHHPMPLLLQQAAHPRARSTTVRRWSRDRAARSAAEGETSGRPQSGR